MNTPRINAGGVKPLQSFNLADYLIGQLYAFSQSKDKAEKLKVLLEIISSIENHTAYKLDISSCTRSTQKFDDEDIMKFLLHYIHNIIVYEDYSALTQIANLIFDLGYNPNQYLKSKGGKR